MRGIQQSIRNTEDTVEIQLDLLRNRILRFELLMNICQTVVGVAGLVTGARMGGCLLVPVRVCARRAKCHGDALGARGSACLGVLPVVVWGLCPRLMRTHSRYLPRSLTRAGVFGMNLLSGLEAHPRAFWRVLTGLAGGMVALFGAAGWWGNRAKVL
jgi:hypothetical protein